MQIGALSRNQTAMFQKQYANSCHAPCDDISTGKPRLAGSLAQSFSTLPMPRLADENRLFLNACHLLKSWWSSTLKSQPVTEPCGCPYVQNCQNVTHFDVEKSMEIKAMYPKWLVDMLNVSEITIVDIWTVKREFRHVEIQLSISVIRNYWYKYLNELYQQITFWLFLNTKYLF